MLWRNAYSINTNEHQIQCKDSGNSGIFRLLQYLLQYRNIFDIFLRCTRVTVTDQSFHSDLNVIRTESIDKSRQNWFRRSFSPCLNTTRNQILTLWSCPKQRCNFWMFYSGKSAILASAAPLRARSRKMCWLHRWFSVIPSLAARRGNRDACQETLDKQLKRKREN